MPDNSDLEREGVAAVELAFRRNLGWSFRDQQVDDYGIDAHIEPKRDGTPTGRLIAAQIKAGQSYFRSEVPGGWWYSTDNDRHLRYWLGHVLPVLMILYHPGTQTCYWQHVTGEHVSYTESGWKLWVPATQTLSAEAAAPLAAIAEAARGASEDPLRAALELLPPTAATALASADKAELAGTLRLAWLLASGSSQPAMTIKSLLAAQPSWWDTGRGRFDLVLASYAAEHEHADLAAEALARTIAATENPSGRLCAQAAHLAALASDWERARSFLKRAEDAGGDPLLCVIVRALADHSGRPGLIRLPDALVDASVDQLAAEPGALMYMGEHALGRRDFQSAVDYLTQAHELLPDASGVANALAHALLGRIATGKAVVIAADMRRAQELAESALYQRRRWSGPSGEILATLIRLRMMADAYATALQLATPASLGGGALDQEASCGQVAVLGAQAALTLGDRQRAAQFAGPVAGSWAEPVIRALTADADAPTRDRIALWRQALTAAVPPQEHMMALSHLAELGAWPFPELDDLQADGLIDAVDHAILTARSEAARGLTDDAVRRLRPHVLRRSSAAEILIDILAEAKRYNEVAEECDRAIRRFGSEAVFIHKKLNALALDGRDEEAATLANKLLGNPATQQEVRAALRKRLAAQYAASYDWAAVEEQCSASLAEGSVDAEMQWGLIAARFNQGQFETAWSSIQELQPEVTDPLQARLWTELHTRFGFTPSDVSAALEFLTRWPDDPALGASILGTFLGAAGVTRPDGGPVLPDLDPVTLHSLHVALDAFTTRYPDGPIKPVRLDGADLAAMVRERAIAHAGRVDVAAEQIRAGQLPLATLAAASGRPYTQVLVQRGCGFIPAVTTSPQAFEAEIRAAGAALGCRVVVELSALAVGTLLPDRWPALLAAFSELQLTRGAAADLRQGCQDLMRAPGTVLSIGYDFARDALVSHELSSADWQYLARRARELTDAAADTVLTDNPSPVHFPGVPDASWVTTLELAAQTKTPLWTDDVVIRALAAGYGIPAFGTVALLHVLVENGAMSDTLRADVQVLAAAGVVDLVLTSDELEHLAASDGWHPASAATALARAIFWACYQPALETFLHMIGEVSSHLPGAVPAWFAAACHGLAARSPAAEVPGRLTGLAHATAAHLGADDQARNTLIEISTDVAKHYTS